MCGLGEGGTLSSGCALVEVKCPRGVCCWGRAAGDKQTGHDRPKHKDPLAPSCQEWAAVGERGEVGLRELGFREQGVGFRRDMAGGCVGVCECVCECEWGGGWSGMG